MTVHKQQKSVKAIKIEHQQLWRLHKHTVCVQYALMTQENKSFFIPGRMECDFLRALPLWRNSVEVCGLLHHQPCIQQSKSIPERRREHARYYILYVFVYMRRTSILRSSHTCELEAFTWAAELCCWSRGRGNGYDMRRQ